LNKVTRKWRYEFNFVNHIKVYLFKTKDCVFEGFNDLGQVLMSAEKTDRFIAQMHDINAFIMQME